MINPLAFHLGLTSRLLWLRCPDCQQVWAAHRPVNIGDVLAEAIRHTQRQHPQAVPPSVESASSITLTNYHRDGSMSVRGWQLGTSDSELVAAMMGEPNGHQLVPADVADEAAKLAPRTVVDWTGPP